jgi:carboxyl-terminal processing protease
VTSSLVGGFLGGSASAVSGSAQNSPNDFIREFTEAIDVIQKNHVDNVGADQLIYSAIKGMLRMLDPHSNFFDPKEFARLREEQHSKYYGLGIRVRKLMPWSDRGRVVIVAPPSIGSPADKRGLCAGDVITNISGQNIDDWTQDEIIDHLRGPRGTTVDITVERPGVRNPLHFRVEREEIPIINVPYAFEVKPGIGYIKIDNFAETTADELKRSLDKLGANKLSGLIIDLRDNPGGLLNQAIDVTDFFIPKSEMIVSTKGRVQNTNRSYLAPSLEKIRVPLVVLINNRSASASEIVAGALQDHDRALIVGETSFGKGLVQSVYPLDGSNTGMALTTARYYTPSGRLIQRDYSGSAFDYYNLPNASSVENKKREVRNTDSGRQVLGGGGITPDAAVPLRELNRFETILASRYIFFEYARRLASGQVPAASNFHLPLKNDEVKSSAQRAELAAASKFEVTASMLDDFTEFLRSQKVEFTAQDISDNIEFIKRGIKQEVFNTAFGLEEGRRVSIQGDTQVQKALELMPEAKMLMTTGRLTPVVQAPVIKK